MFLSENKFKTTKEIEMGKVINFPTSKDSLWLELKKRIDAEFEKTCLEDKYRKEFISRFKPTLELMYFTYELPITFEFNEGDITESGVETLNNSIESYFSSFETVFNKHITKIACDRYVWEIGHYFREIGFTPS